MAAIFVAALLLGAVPIPEIVGAFYAHDFAADELHVPDGVTITSTINPANGVPVLRVDNASTERVWVPLFELAPSKLSGGEIRYRMTFDTEVPANYVQPGVELSYASSEPIVTASVKNVGSLELAEPPLFTAEAKYWNRREEAPESAAFGVMLYGPGVVNIEQAEVMAMDEPFKGFTTESLLLACAATGLLLLAATSLAGMTSATSRIAMPALVRNAFALAFVIGFFVLPQFESAWTIPCILFGALGYLAFELPVVRGRLSQH